MGRIVGSCGCQPDAEFSALINSTVVLALIERLECAEDAIANPLLTGIQIHENSMDIGLKGAAAQIFAEAFAAQFKDSGATNYLEVHLASNDPAVGELLVTLQRKQGKTPHQFRREAEERLERAEADIRRLDSGVIMTSERNDFGEEYKCERRGLDLRAMIDEAMEAGKR
ncbi:MAG: hypothetical protein JSV72_07340 [Ralstonia sp.]|nr:MAG: hypothetical protein JSV72_07340 [Ralstonia sp.]